MLVFGTAGAGFGRASVKHAAGSSGSPTAPVLILVSATAAATFTIDVDNTIGAGDLIELQIQATGGGWTTLVADPVHTITAGEDTANSISLSLGLPNGNYDARARVEEVSTGLYSSFSNTVTNFTISGNISNATFYIYGF
jgi:hypothetical protein